MWRLGLSVSHLCQIFSDSSFLTIEQWLCLWGRKSVCALTNAYLIRALVVVVVFPLFHFSLRLSSMRSVSSRFTFPWELTYQFLVLLVAGYSSSFSLGVRVTHLRRYRFQSHCCQPSFGPCIRMGLYCDACDWFLRGSDWTPGIYSLVSIHCFNILRAAPRSYSADHCLE